MKSTNDRCEVGKPLVLMKKRTNGRKFNLVLFRRMPVAEARVQPREIASASKFLQQSQMQTTTAQSPQPPATSTQPWTPSAPRATSKSQSFLDWLKPHRSVAIARLKNNGLAMIVLLLITQLSPITPSPLKCLWLILTGGRGMSG